MLRMFFHPNSNLINQIEKIPQTTLKCSLNVIESQAKFKLDHMTIELTDKHSHLLDLF